MKRVSTVAFALALASCAAFPFGARGQAGVRPRVAQEPDARDAGKGAAAGADAAAKPSEAQALYDEAAAYAQRKFDEFREKQMPFDRALEQKTLQEQKDLALQNAARVAVRGPLSGTDLYYTGLLYALAGKGDGALDSMRRFIADAAPAPAGLKQRARSVAAQQAAQLGLLEEAERMLAEYARSEPRAVSDLHRINLVLSSAYVKRKDYARAVPRAGDAYAAALEYARTGAANPEQRDATLFGAGNYYTNALVRAGRRPEALRVIQELRARAVALPSARLYGQATDLLLRQGEKFDLPPELPGVEPAVSPELKFAATLGRGPVKLSELRGKVVLLDFWATWCTFCVRTMPRLNAMHQRYGERGLVILGINEFEGHIEGRNATRAEELEYFRQFKNKMKVPYDFAVAEGDANDKLYGVAALPTAVLIDRRGRVRFITVGADEDEAALLTKMVVRLLDEKP